MNTTPDDKSSARSQRARFVTTSWSLVVQATDPQSEESRVALESLCQRYWYPLYAFVRRKGNSPSTAEDLTQSFFVFLLEKKGLALADRARGRFRTFLLSALDNFLKNEWRRQSTQKRGGQVSIISIDYELGEQRYQNEPVHDLTAEKIYERSWAMTLLGSALNELASHYSQAGKSDLFDRLKPFLAGQGNVPYAEMAELLDLSEGAVKVAVHRMRSRCREILREKIGETVQTRDEIDREIADLFAIVEN